MQFQELEKVAVEAKEAGIIKESATPELVTEIINKEKYAFVEIAPINQELALVGLRIEIERRLRKLAEKYSLEFKLGLNRVIRDLENKSVLTAKETSVFNQMLNTLNHAAHGVE